MASDSGGGERRKAIRGFVVCYTPDRDEKITQWWTRAFQRVDPADLKAALDAHLRESSATELPPPAAIMKRLVGAPSETADVEPQQKQESVKDLIAEAERLERADQEGRPGPAGPETGPGPATAEKPEA